MYFFTEEILTAAFCDGPEPGQSMRYLRKLQERFSVLVLDTKKQPTSRGKKTAQSKAA